MNIAYQLLLILLLAGYAYILFRTKLNGKVVRRSALIIFTAGVVLYMYGFALEPSRGTFVPRLLRSIVNSAKMFIYNGELFEIPEAQVKPGFLELYELTYYAAILTSISAIIMLFGKRAMTFLTLLLRRKPFRHVFIGVNNHSQMIAKGILDEEIAFIEFPDDNAEEKISAGTVLKGIAGNEKKEQVFGKHITILRAKRHLAARLDGDNVFEQIGLGRLKRLVSPDTDFYILSDDSERNFRELLALVSDNGLSSNTIHASVRREGLASSYKGVLGKTGAHFIFPSSLSVVELMKSPSCHPASVMNFSPEDCSASGSFNALVVGFGETGQAATKFIYEFASAIRKDGSPLPTNIFICDSRMERLKGQFSFSSPEMEHGIILEYEEAGLDSGKFWNDLQAKIDKLNYVVLAMDDDGTNLNLACTIFSYALQKRKNGLDNLRILVRKRYTPEYEKKLVARMNEKAGMQTMICFGEYEKIFTPEMIVSRTSSGINSSATDLASRLEKQYLEITGDTKTEKTASTYHEKRRQRRETHQFISRANHIPTKLMMTSGKRDLTPEMLENLARCEHLRYSRYLKAHGYTSDAVDDDVLKTNHQLCSWNELSDEDRQYHRNMVKASLATDISTTN